MFEALVGLGKVARSGVPQSVCAMKKRVTKAKIAELERRIEVQRKRAARPATPINAHATVSKSLAEKKKALDRKARQRKDWEKE